MSSMISSYFDLTLDHLIKPPKTKCVTLKSGIWDFVKFKIVGQGVPHRIFYGYGSGMLSIGKFQFLYGHHSRIIPTSHQSTIKNLAEGWRNKVQSTSTHLLSTEKFSKLSCYTEGLWNRKQSDDTNLQCIPEGLLLQTEAVRRRMFRNWKRAQGKDKLSGILMIFTKTF